MTRILLSLLGGCAGLIWMSFCASTVATLVGAEEGAVLFAISMFMTFAWVTFFAWRDE
jgi:hypothetical protein